MIPAPSITKIGSGLNFLSVNRLTANSPSAAKSRSDRLNEKPAVPKSAAVRMERPEEAIRATTAGRRTFIMPWTRLRPLNLL